MAAILFFEPGMPTVLPGIPPGFPSHSFPVWGNYTFLDIHLSNFPGNEGLYFFYREEENHIFIKLMNRLKKKGHSCMETANISSFLKQLNQIPVEDLILTTFDYAAFLDFPGSTGYNISGADETVKIAVENIPLNCYACRKSTLINRIKKNLNRNTEHLTPAAFLFSELPAASTDKILNMEGRLLFHNNLMQLYTCNIRLLTSLFSKDHRKLSDFISDTEIRGSSVSSTGYVKNSLIGSGVEVMGYIENSILFRGVRVARGTEIRNSVIMDGNKIGKNCRIDRTLLLPFFDEAPNNYYNIKEEIRIGGQNSIIRNFKYSDQIYNGVSVIGMNAHLPKGIVIEPGAFIGAGVEEKLLKNLDKIKKGDTFEL